MTPEPSAVCICSLGVRSRRLPKRNWNGSSIMGPAVSERRELVMLTTEGMTAWTSRVNSASSAVRTCTSLGSILGPSAGVYCSAVRGSCNRWSS